MTIDRRKFEDSIMPYLGTETVKLIMDRYGWDENTAIERFMKSIVYDRLQEEETKVWHFSPCLLAELFDEEQNGEIDWPEI